MPTVITVSQLSWLPLLLSVLTVGGYELWFRARARRHPLAFARTAHARLRMRWVHELMATPGTELLAIQTIRNSVMSATVTASTAVLALTGAVTFLSNRLGAEGLQAVIPAPGTVLTALLMAILFLTFLFSTMAVRFFNHAGYLMGSQSRGDTRSVISHLAARYMVRAGNYYSQGMRALLWLPPAGLGLVNPWLMPAAAVALIVVMRWFDRAPEPLDERLLTTPELPS